MPFLRIKVKTAAEVVGSVGNSEGVFQADCGKIFDFSTGCGTFHNPILSH